MKKRIAYKIIRPALLLGVEKDEAQMKRKIMDSPLSWRLKSALMLMKVTGIPGGRIDCRVAKAALMVLRRDRRNASAERLGENAEALETLRYCLSKNYETDPRWNAKDL